MILFIILLTVLVLLAIIALSIGGAVLVAFSDLIVFVFIIACIVKLIKKSRKKGWKK